MATPNIIKATALTDTWLKDSSRNSDACGHIVLAKKDTVLELEWYELDNPTNHLYFLFYPEGDRVAGYDGEMRWWGFAPDWKIEGTEVGNDPKEIAPQGTQPATPKAEKSYEIPGITAPITPSQPIYAGSNFTWGEALWGGATGDRPRIPEHPGITSNIVKLARYMDAVRKDLGGKPIRVTSWYRDSKTNKLVGGAKWSQHLQGHAIDFAVVGEDVVTTFNRLKRFKRGQLSLAVGNGFVHLDLRPGGPARWTYPRGPKVALW